MGAKVIFLQNEAIEGPAQLEALFNKNGFNSQIVKMYDNDPIPAIDEIDAVVILGGPMNVDDDDKHLFLKREVDFLKEVIKKDLPCLGICLGSQLIAKSAGARVYKNSIGEIGWYSVSLTEKGKKDPLFDGLKEKINVFQWHHDTFDIPAKAIHLASSVFCSNQSFRLGNNVYGLQFHFEITDEDIIRWAEKYLKQDDIQKQVQTKIMISDYELVKNRFAALRYTIINNFLKIIKENKN